MGQKSSKVLSDRTPRFGLNAVDLEDTKAELRRTDVLGEDVLEQLLFRMDREERRHDRATADPGDDLENHGERVYCIIHNTFTALFDTM